MNSNCSIPISFRKKVALSLKNSNLKIKTTNHIFGFKELANLEQSSIKQPQALKYANLINFLLIPINQSSKKTNAHFISYDPLSSQANNQIHIQMNSDEYSGT